MATHHITNKMLEDKPAFEGSEMKQAIVDLVKENILVAHNAPFDIQILKNEGIEVPRHICTFRVARHLDAEGKIPRFGLQYLRYFLDLDITDAPAHDAKGDVLVTEALFNRLFSKAKEEAGSDEAALEKMMMLSKQPVMMRKMPFGKHKGKDIKEIVERDSAYLRWLLDAKRSEAALGNKNPNDEDLIYTIEAYLR